MICLFVFKLILKNTVETRQEKVPSFIKYFLGFQAQKVEFDTSGML